MHKSGGFMHKLETIGLQLSDNGTPTVGPFGTNQQFFKHLLFCYLSQNS